MTIQEFKKLKPKYKDIDGNQLWDAMEDYMLQQQQESEILKVIMPIWKTHTFRWLFYRRVPNMLKQNYRLADNRCKSCKKGVNSRFIISMRQEDGTWKSYCNCPHCNKEYIAEPNTNLSYKLWKYYEKIISLFWWILDKLHLVKSSVHGRYDMFGDEARYVKHWTYNKKDLYPTSLMKKRKWWEYILIEKSFHKF